MERYEAWCYFLRKSSLNVYKANCFLNFLPAFKICSSWRVVVVLQAFILHRRTDRTLDSVWKFLRDVYFP